MAQCSFCGLTGHVVKPNDPLYKEARQEWNRAIQKFPLAIVYCRDKFDVGNAVLWARRNDIGIRIRSGGHNYEGYSTGNDILVIDLSLMNSMRLDEKNDLVTMQGGVNLRQFYGFVSSKGYPFPGGTCPTVGLSGFASGGGWGLSCRNFGLGCDSLKEFEIVDYKGNFITANCECNPELFWACRGAGGGNFGVIISMTFVLPPKTRKVTLIEIYYPHVSSEKQALFIDVWQQWLSTADNRVTLIANVNNSEDEGMYVFVRGIFYGTPEEAEKIIRLFLDICGAKYDLKYLTFLEAVTEIGESYPSSEMFKSTGRFVEQTFSPDEIIKVVGLIKTRPTGSILTGLTLYALGGKVAQVGRQDTAFFYRKAKYIILIQSVWVDPKYEKVNVEWVADKFMYLKSMTAGSYVNFPYSGLKYYLEEYYGTNAQRLEKVKKKYDPLNIFTFPQGINGFHTDSKG